MRLELVWNLVSPPSEGAFAHLQLNGLSEMQPPCTPPERNEKPGLFKDGRTNARDGNSTLTISGGQALRAIGR